MYILHILIVLLEKPWAPGVADSVSTTSRSFVGMVNFVSPALSLSPSDRLILHHPRQVRHDL